MNNIYINVANTPATPSFLSNIRIIKETRICTTLYNTLKNRITPSIFGLKILKSFTGSIRIKELN
ncbi:MAG: hypothetical protein K6F99_11585 [Lachnospiraceae bacterium]|nr:hypothetical protein [Lachnospiraceae bacterium]